MPQKDKAKLVLKEVTTKSGKRGKYWVDPNKDQPKDKTPKAEESKEKKGKEEQEDTLANLSEALASKVSRKQEGHGSKIFLNKKEVSEILSKGMFAMVSADSNPNDMDHDKKKKGHWMKQRHALIKDIQDMGLMFMPCIGKYGSVERSYLIFSPEMNKQEVYDLGKKYGQDSVIWGKGGKNELIYTTGENKGKANVGKSFNWLSSDQGDAWTEFVGDGGKPQKFNINFNFNKMKKIKDVKKAADELGALSSFIESEEKVEVLSSLSDSDLIKSDDSTMLAIDALSITESDVLNDDNNVGGDIKKGDDKTLVQKQITGADGLNKFVWVKE